MNMCMKCLVLAVMTGSVSMEEVLGAGSIEAAIKMAQDRVNDEEETPAQWRARTISEMELEIKTKEAVLHYVTKLPVESRALSIIGSAHKIKGTLQLVVIYDTPDGLFNVHEHYPGNVTQDHTWRAPTYEIAESIAESVMERLDQEAADELKREQAEA